MFKRVYTVCIFLFWYVLITKIRGIQLIFWGVGLQKSGEYKFYCDNNEKKRVCVTNKGNCCDIIILFRSRLTKIGEFKSLNIVMWKRVGVNYKN